MIILVCLNTSNKFYIYNVKHLKKYNEGLFDNILNRNPKKDDLYISKYKFVSRVNSPEKSDNIYAYNFQDLDLAKDKVISYLEQGVFRKTTEYYRTFKFGQFNNGDVWFDPVGVYDKLRKINDKLGFKLGAEVYVNPLRKNARIVKIVNGALYDVHDDVFHKGFDYKLTLFFRVDGSSDYYQITHLDLVKEKKKTNVVESYIKDIFSDLIDEDKIVYSIGSYFVRDQEVHTISIESVNVVSASFVSDVFKYIDSAKKELLNDGVELRIRSIECDSQTKMKLFVILEAFNTSN